MKTYISADGDIKLRLVNNHRTGTNLTAGHVIMESKHMVRCK